MPHITDHPRTAAVIDMRTQLAVDVADHLQNQSWSVDTGNDTEIALRADHRVDPLTAIIYIPALYHDDCGDSSTVLIDICARAATAFTGVGGAVVVTVSADLLGSAGRPRIAATSAALVATARSLALRYASEGITVNVVAVPAAVLRDHAGVDEDDRPALLPHAVSGGDVAGSIAFFSDPRSRYITGQVFYCCGGSSLLSSLSV
ncbi:SDR family oxidoreductase [Nocardia sp. NPDC052112]|uniref:SDR family oxidoreductase n=1 Tax=Nocardia sp. NPDC052112 TaxID=3155646 RepID=UPI0034186686